MNIAKQIEQVEPLLHKLRVEYYKRKMTMMEAGLDVLQQNDGYLQEALMDLNLNAKQKRTNEQYSRELAQRRSQRETYRQLRLGMQYRNKQQLPPNQRYSNQAAHRQNIQDSRVSIGYQQNRYYDEHTINQINSRIKQLRSKDGLRAQQPIQK